MKKLLVSVLAAMMICSITACGGGKTAGTGNVGGLSEEELAKQEEEAMKEKEEALKQEEEAKKEELGIPSETGKEETAVTTEAQVEVDPEAVLAEALPTILPIPEGEYEYDYEWSDRLNRVNYYIVRYTTPVDYMTFSDYVFALVEAGYEDPGKGEWSEEEGESYYLSWSTAKIPGIRIYFKPTGDGDKGILTFEFYVNERL